MVLKIKIDGDVAKKIRKAKYQTQDEMSKQALAQNEQISKRTIISIEKGDKVKPQTLRTYAKLIDKTVDELRSADDKKLLSEDYGNVDLRKKSLFGIANKKTLIECEAFVREGGQKPNWHLELTDLSDGAYNKNLFYLTKHTDAVPAPYAKIFAAMTAKSEILYLANNNDELREGDELGGMLRIPTSVIWVVQDDLIITKEAIKILKNFQTAVEPHKLSEAGLFSVGSMTKELEARVLGKEYIDELEANYALGFFSCELESRYFHSYPKSWEREYHNFEDFDLHEVEASVFDVTSICKRPVIALGNIKNSSIKITYKKKDFDIPF